MQSVLIKRWNDAIAILEKESPLAQGQQYPRLSPFGNCCGLTFTFLSYASREDLETFYRYINYITRQPAITIAQMLKSNSRFANELFRFVVMIASLQKNQSLLSLNNGQLSESANVSRINVNAHSKVEVEVVNNQTSAKNIIEKLAINEGLGIFSEAHAYGIYRTKTAWIVFDSNSTLTEFRSIENAASELLEVLEFNAMSYSFAKMTTMSEFIQSILYMLNKCINLFRNEKTLSSPISLSSTTVSFDKFKRNSDSSNKQSYVNLLKNLPGKNHAESMAIKAIAVNDIELLKLIIKKHHLDINKPWQVWQGNANYKTHPILEAVRSNSVDALAVLLSLQVDVNVVDRNGNNALIYAIKNSNEDIVRLLVNHFVDPHRVNCEGFSPLSLANHQGNSAIVRILELNDRFSGNIETNLVSAIHAKEISRLNQLDNIRASANFSR